MGYILSISYRNQGVSKEIAEEYYKYFIDNQISEEHIFFDKDKQTDLSGSEMNKFLENYSQTHFDLVFFSDEYLTSNDCVKEIEYLISKYQRLKNENISVDNRLFIIQCDKKKISEEYPVLKQIVFIAENINHSELKNKIFNLANHILPVSVFKEIDSKWRDKLSGINFRIISESLKEYEKLLNNKESYLFEIIKGTSFYNDIASFFKHSNVLVINGAISFGKTIILKQLENEIETNTTQCHDINDNDIEYIKSFDDLAIAIHTDLRKYSDLKFRTNYISESEIKAKLNPNRRVANKFDLFLGFLQGEIVSPNRSITLIVNLDNIERFCDINTFKELHENLARKENQNLNLSKDINLVIVTRFWPSAISNTIFVKNIPPLEHEDAYKLFNYIFRFENIDQEAINSLVSFIWEVTNGILWLISKIYSTYINERLLGSKSSPYSLLMEIIGDFKKILYKKNGELEESLKKAHFFIIEKKIDDKEIKKILSIENSMPPNEIEKFASSELLKFLGLIIPENINWDEYNKVNVPYVILLHRRRLIEKIKNT